MASSETSGQRSTLALPSASGPSCFVQWRQSFVGAAVPRGAEPALIAAHDFARESLGVHAFDDGAVIRGEDGIGSSLRGCGYPPGEGDGETDDPKDEQRLTTVGDRHMQGQKAFEIYT